MAQDKKPRSGARFERKKYTRMFHDRRLPCASVKIEGWGALRLIKEENILRLSELFHEYADREGSLVLKIIHQRTENKTQSRRKVFSRTVRRSSERE